MTNAFHCQTFWWKHFKNMLITINYKNKKNRSSIITIKSPRVYYTCFFFFNIKDKKNQKLHVLF